MTHNIKNKLALITGAASGIGLTTAQLFAKEGADLALADISPKMGEIAKQLQESHPHIKVSAHTLDLTLSSNVDNLFNEINENHHTKHYSPNVLINSAGIAKGKSLMEIGENEYDTLIGVNLKATFLVTQAFIKLLMSNYKNVKFDSPTQSYASIVNLSSVSGRFGAAGMTHYGMTKAGVEGFAKCVAKEYGTYRIRCNAILPYIIETPMADSLLTEEMRRVYSEKPVLKRLGKAEEVAQLIYFLATDSSSYITGTGIDINGGAY